MEELKPLREYLSIELWQYEDGELGWRVKSQCNESIDWNVAGHLMLEMAEHFHSGPDDEMVASFFINSRNAITTRYARDRDFTTFDEWVWLNEFLHKIRWFCVKKRHTALGLRPLGWTLAFLWHKLLGHLKRSQSAPRATPTAPTTSLTEMLSEPSEASEPGSQAGHGPGKVLQFPERAND